MLLLIPILLPVISGTVLLIKKWKKKPWRFGRFLLLSSLINSAVVLGFLIAQYQETLTVAIAGQVAFCLSADGLGSIFAGCMALLFPAILSYSVGTKAELVKKEDRTDNNSIQASTKEGTEKQKNRAKDRKDEGSTPVVTGLSIKMRAKYALLNDLFAVILGLAFSKNAATMAFFLILMAFLLFAAAYIRKNGDQFEKRNLLLIGCGALIVFFVLMVAVFAGGGEVFYFDGFLMGKISDPLLLILYLICFLGCAVRSFAGPLIAGRRETDRGTDISLHDTASEKEQKENRKEDDLIFRSENLLADAVSLFILLRMTFSVFGISLLRGTWVQAVVLLLSAAGVVFYAVTAPREKKMPKKMSYLCSASFFLALTGIAVMTSHGYTAAVWMMISFVAAQLLFIFFLEAVREKCGGLEEIAPGTGRKMPVTFGCYVVAAFSIGAVPPLAGFLGVWKLAKAFTRQGGLNYLSMAAMFVFLFLAVFSLYPLTIRAFFPKQEPVGKVKPDEVSLWMLVPMVGLAAAVIAVGFFSGTLGEYIYQIGLGLM